MNLQPSHATVSTCKQRAPGQIQRPGVQRGPELCGTHNHGTGCGGQNRL